jgi:hypothetical protein
MHNGRHSGNARGRNCWTAERLSFLCVQGQEGFVGRGSLAGQDVPDSRAGFADLEYLALPFELT